MKPTTEEKLNEWRLLFEERQQRKITVKELCKEKNISPAQFYYYQEIINKPKKLQVQIKNQKEKRLRI